MIHDSHMLEARWKKRTLINNESFATKMAAELARLRSTGALSDSKLSIRTKGIGTMVVVTSEAGSLARRNVPIPSVLAIGFSTIVRSNDVAKAYSVCARTVGRFRTVTAFVH